MLLHKANKNLCFGARYCGLGYAIHRSPRMRPSSHPGWPVRSFSTTRHASRPAVLAVSGNVTTDPEDLRCHTSHRWLFDEEMQLAGRYVPFDPQALGSVASDAVGSSCLRIDKVAEDNVNRTLLLSFENGREAVARFPYSVLGPTDLIAASEAATTQFVRDTVGLPVPKVLAYSSRAHRTSVGAAYIITEKPRGVPLGAVSKHMQPTQQKAFIEDLAILLHSYSEIPFAWAGSLYFTEDIKDFPHSTDIFGGAALFPNNDPQYAIGPSVDWELWRGARQHLDMDRGPWASPLSCVDKIIQCQQTWLETIPRARHPQAPAYYNEEDASPAVHIAALDDLLACLPHILPSAPKLMYASLGPHRQLGGNLHIDPSSHTVADIVDWQRATILPYFMQRISPVAFNGPPYPVPDDAPNEPEADVAMAKELIDAVNTGTDPNAKYLALGLFRSLLEQGARYWGERTIRPLFRLPLRTWQHSVLLLRQQLVWMQDNWAECVTDGAPCPLRFSEEESERILHDAWQFSHRTAMSWMLALRMDADDDGRVPTEKYAEARMLCDELAKEWDPDEKGPFPFQDGGRTAMNS
ncbi:hypothetical protein LXA43DRAFT_1091234 [Ganoderma leucocontextum]|nr:hypothetical protein LXA43DRAFT_1091234 [Ganoderma leucocontextum]